MENKIEKGITIQMWVKWPSINRPIEFFSPSKDGSSFGLFSLDKIFHLSIVSFPSSLIGGKEKKKEFLFDSPHIFLEFSYENNPSFTCLFYFKFNLFSIIIIFILFLIYNNLFLLLIFILLQLNFYLLFITLILIFIDF